MVDVLRERARRSPERSSYVFLRDGEREETRLVNHEIDRRARALAALLQRLNARGERALLLYPTSPDFVTAFFGCLYAGVVAVPAPAPGPGRLARDLPRLRAIVGDARPRLVLTTSRVHRLLPMLTETAPELAALSWLATDTLPLDGADDWRDLNVDAGSIAYLQYTSGSTADPKGVVITHANVMHNAAWSQQQFEAGDASVTVSWLPMYHDMGLVGALLAPLHSGTRAVLMSPEACLQRPVRWLSAITKYRADISGGPNFAFEHCLRRIAPDERATLDLSTWRVAFTGAEPVRAATLERFTQAFAPHGFRGSAFVPCYGLAEATLLVTAGRRHASPAIRRLHAPALERGQAVDADDRTGHDRTARVVGCGPSASDQRIVIVDPDTRRERRRRDVGEIWISGPSVARGYWNRADETEGTFHARIVDGGDHSFLRTGDLGFLDDDELFVTGRLKDLIIIDGRNHYPQDVEQTAEAADAAIRPGSCAAFAIDTGSEDRLVIVAEMQRPRNGQDALHDVGRAIRLAVATVHGIDVHAVRLLNPGGVPRTSSGKLQRLACREAFLNGVFDGAGGGDHGQPA